MFVIKPSQIPGAGLGLFTKRRIKSGQKIIEYKGTLITGRAKCDRIYRTDYEYVLEIDSEHCLDARKNPEVLGRYANDANGTTKVHGLTNNAVFQIYGLRAWIVATRYIKANEEIFVSYGNDYWPR